MSIATELQRIIGAKANLKTAIENKGVTVSSSALIDEYPALVDSIPTGGGGGVVPKDVNFIDFDGTLLHSYTLAEAQALTALPDAPDHSGDDIPLVFDRWNYTLADIQEELEDTSKITVGANYHTADGLTHLVWKVEAGDQVRINSVSPGATINWGDGETTTGQISTINHTYAAAGVYDCKVSGTSIAVGASSNTYARRYTRLNEARLSQSITSIAASAFFYCSLQRVSIPQGVTSIGNSAFNQCRLLQSVTIPRGVTGTGSSLFEACSSLQSVSIPQSVTSLGSYAFNNCYSLHSITIPQGVTSIGNYAFSGCYSLQSVSIPHGVTSIGSSAFYSCSSLQSVSIPQSVTSIGGSAFGNCYSLHSITIPQGVTSIDSSAFGNCASLHSITIPQSVTSIGNYAFSGCYSLQSVVIPQGVTTINSDVFSSCYSLQSVTIPSSVTSIEARSFSGCYFETLVFESDVPPTISSTNSFASSYITKVVVPKGSLEAYQNATNLSQLADKMVEADE